MPQPTSSSFVPSREPLRLPSFLACLTILAMLASLGLAAVPQQAAGAATAPTFVTNSVANSAGWALLDGTKQWLPASCRVQLEGAGASFGITAWSEYGSLPATTSPLSCDGLEALLTTTEPPAVTYQLVQTPQSLYDDGWLLASEDGTTTKQWLDWSCVDELESAGVVAETVRWSTLAAYDSILKAPDCEAARRSLLGLPPLPTPPTPSPGCERNTSVPQTECEALVELHEGAGNWPGWQTWDDPCRWTGISCADGHVVGIVTPNAQYFSGALPASIGDFAHLEVLTITGAVRGQLPPEIGRLTSLRSFSIRTFFFVTKPAPGTLEGPLPAELGALTDLEVLSLPNNQISGALPNIGQLQRLRVLDLSNNQLTSVPTDLGLLSAIETIDLSGNFITSVPPQLGQLDSLVTLDLSNNALVVLPPQLGALTSLVTLDLSNNALVALPPQLGALTSLVTLNVSSNSVTGTIPPELGSLSNLETLYLADNSLSGEIPPELGQLGNLTTLSMPQNQLVGPIPTQLSSLTSLVSLNLASNQLSGDLPASFVALGSLRALTLSGMCIDDSDPSLVDWLRGLSVRPGWTCDVPPVHAWLARRTGFGYIAIGGNYRLIGPYCLGLLDAVGAEYLGWSPVGRVLDESVSCDDVVAALTPAD